MSEDKQYDFYVAGPFFDPEQTASMERLEKILEDHGKVLFKPRFVSQIEEAGPEGCFADDIRGINAAKAVGPDDVAKYLETGEHTEVDYIQF